MSQLRLVKGIAMLNIDLAKKLTNLYTKLKFYMQVHLNHCKTKITEKLNSSLFWKVLGQNPKLKNILISLLFMKLCLVPFLLRPRTTVYFLLLRKTHIVLFLFIFHCTFKNISFALQQFKILFRLCSFFINILRI